jgi:hypothetical protein
LVVPRVLAAEERALVQMELQPLEQPIRVAVAVELTTLFVFLWLEVLAW